MDKAEPQTNKRITHTIRGKNGQRVELPLTRAKAIKLFCTECLGYETHPKDCTHTLCPLYPYRGKSLAAHPKPLMSPEV